MAEVRCSNVSLFDGDGVGDDERRWMILFFGLLLAKSQANRVLLLIALALCVVRSFATNYGYPICATLPLVGWC